MRAAVAAGKFPFKAPLGYRNVAGGREAPNLMRGEVTAPFIEQAFELYGKSGHSAEDVRRTLNALGFRTAKGKEVPKQTFAAILRNPLYVCELSSYFHHSESSLASPTGFEPVLPP